jgi:glycopeptide antibiotics resistance protein
MLMKKSMKIIISLALSILFFWIFLDVINGSAYSNIAMLLSSCGLATFINPLFFIILALLISIVIFANLYQIINNNFHVLFFKIEMAVYLVLFMAIVMLKSAGVQKININIMDIFTQIAEDPLLLLINILLFVPIGMIFFIYCKSALMAFVSAFVMIIVIETMQYIFCLGISDIVDVVANMVGFSLGYMSLDIAKEYGVHVVSEDMKYLKIVFPQKEAYTTQPSSCKKLFTMKKGIVTIAIALSFALMFFFGFYLYDYKGYEPWENIIEATTDTTLRSLPESLLTPEEAVEIINEMSLFRICETESSKEWIKVDESGVFHSNGSISQCSVWLRDEVKYYGISLGSIESLEGFTVMHGIPLIVTPHTELHLSGEVVSRDRLDSLLDEFYLYNIEAEYTLQNGWFQAETIFLSQRLPEEIEYYVSFDYYNLSRDTDSTRGFNVSGG